MVFAILATVSQEVPTISDQDCFCWGALGGVFLEVCHWHSLLTKPKFPTYVRKARYWIVTGLMVAFGGLIAVLLMRSNAGVMSDLSAFATGFMAPSFQTRLKRVLPNIPDAGGPDAGGSSAAEGYRDFFDW